MTLQLTVRARYSFPDLTLLVQVTAGCGNKPGIRVSEHLTGAGHTIFEHACKLGLEGIVSKRLSSHTDPGKAKCWIKVKNP